MPSVHEANSMRRTLRATGLTHEQLSRIFGRSRATISKWSSGKMEPLMGERILADLLAQNRELLESVVTANRHLILGPRTCRRRNKAADDTARLLGD